MSKKEQTLMATTIERRRFLSFGVMGITGVLLSPLFLHSSFAFSESNPAGAKIHQ
jgi:hypothetical protein